MAGNNERQQPTMAWGDARIVTRSNLGRHRDSDEQLREGKEHNNYLGVERRRGESARRGEGEEIASEVVGKV